MAPPPPLALRIAGQDHALEADRDYLLGSANDCDLVLRVRDVAARHLRLRVGTGGVEVEDLAGPPAEPTRLQVGDVLRVGDLELLLVPDHGDALLVPLPAMRTAAAARRVRGAATALLRARESESFEQMMAGELRRAPWFAVSVGLHVLLLLVLWLLAPRTPIGDDGPKTVAVDLMPPAPVGEPVPPPPDVVTEVPPVDFAPLPELVPDPAADPSRDAAPPVPGTGLRANPRLAARGSGGDAGLSAEARNVGSTEFRRTIAELQRGGLEIVFVFDSTGSMSRTILDTKNSIAQMLAVLRALVPDARVGIVTYRDRHRGESYLVRQVPLGSDFWRASNFVQVVTAEGGGDRPEDVRAGLRAAFAQRWRADARRVVVLAGDAPPHERDVSSLLADVRQFARNGRSFVHTLVTSPDSVDKATRDTFAEIAATGNGTCTDLDAHQRVLQRVLTLAFGRDFEQDVAAVVRATQAATERVDVAALDLVHRGGPDLLRALRAEPVPVVLLQALARRPRRAVTLALVDEVGNRSTPERTRHAIAWVLQHLFELAVPPVDPESGATPDAAVLARLRVRCADLPD